MLNNICIQTETLQLVQRQRFLVRDSIYTIARSLLTPVHLSVCPSVCHMGGSVKDGYS